MAKIVFFFFVFFLSFSFANATNARMCTADYRPVCGIDAKTGERKIYGNACARDVANAKSCEENVNFSDSNAVFSWAKNSGLTTAGNINSFRPNDTISREEVAGVLLRAFEKNLFPDRATTMMIYIPNDSDAIAPEFSQAINFAYNARIMRGNGQNFLPKHSLTHLEAMLVILRSAHSDADFATKTYPWYTEYVKAFNNRINTETSEKFLNAPISRETFFAWIKAFADQNSPKMENDFSLDGNWQLETFAEKNNNPQKISASIAFDKNTISGKFCNTINGEISYKDGIFSTKGLASTRMLCGDENLMNAEMNFRLDGAKFSLEKSRTELIITTKNENVYTFSRK